MPSLAQKSVISLDYKEEGFKPRRVSGGSDPEKTGNKLSEMQKAHGLPYVRVSLETSAISGYGPNFWRENGWRGQLLERRQTLGLCQEDAGESITPNKERTTVGTPVKPRLNETVKFLPTRYSEWFSRISSLNERIGVKTADASSKTRAQQSRGQNKTTNAGQNTKGVQARKSQLRRKTEVPKKTLLTDNVGGKYSEVFSKEREVYFQDYRQKCIQWLKSLPDNGTLAMNLR